MVLSVNGRKFLGCSRFPECKNTKSLSTGVHCPHPGCDGSIVERRTRRGKIFFGCSSYPKCTFATWDRPVDTKCAACGFAIMVQKETRRKGPYLSCPSCRAEVTLLETAGQAQAEPLAAEAAES